MNVSKQLLEVIKSGEEQLRVLSATAAKAQPAPDKWAPIQVIGHLIDSACNNHIRFIKATFQDSLVFPGYAQDAWVKNQHYLNADWNNTLTLWAAYNRHLAHVFASIPEDVRLRPRKEHDFKALTYGYADEPAPNNLEYLMKDYVGHLMNHLRALGVELNP